MVYLFIAILNHKFYINIEVSPGKLGTGGTVCEIEKIIEHRNIIKHKYSLVFIMVCNIIIFQFMFAL